MCRLLALFLIAFITFYGCSAQRKSAASKKNAIEVIPDNIRMDSSGFDDEYTVTSIEKKVEGKWDVKIMYRHQDSGAENLLNVTLTLADSAFGGNAPCNSIAGSYIVHDTNIKFTDIVSTKMACDKLNQETIYLELLKNTVSSFAVKENKLLLKDGSGKVVFECIKEKDFFGLRKE